MNILFSQEVSQPLKQSDHKAVVQEDPATGFVEFPSPGDVKKHLLPLFMDPEEDRLKAAGEQSSKKSVQADEYWMPDKLCKICYKCELPFTMYRRRHHCRMCGQIFCNQCSSFYIEQGVMGQTVRCCRLCYDQLGASYDQDLKQQMSLEKRITTRSTRRLNSTSLQESGGDSNHEEKSHPTIQRVATAPGIGVFEDPADRERCVNDLEMRANMHLTSIVHLLISQSSQLQAECNQDLLNTWENIIVKLVREVVNYVDPDVRSGDSLDIRPYVKLKVIPGGTLADNTFINGVVFRKNVSHKKMANEKNNPRLLLLGGGIEFQREDQKLSSLDTLIEQEDKYTEILVDKIMSLKPDIILVGGSVARKAQEILCSHNVVVMQNVKASLLERVSRMTGALMLPSTDHMIQRYGEDCLGSCGRFWLRKIHDNEGDVDVSDALVVHASDARSHKKHGSSKQALTRITNKQKSTTYAYFEGCPPELGCTLILRGGDKKVLIEIKRIIKFSVMLAYHLRLEVAYYTDRCGSLPLNVNMDKCGYESEDDLIEEWKKDRSQCKKEPEPVSLHNNKNEVDEFLENPIRRSLLSTSFDVDIKKPFQDEVRFDATMTRLKNQIFEEGEIDIPDKASPRKLPSGLSTSPEDHQTLLVTSLLMTRPANAGQNGGAMGNKVDRTLSVSGDQLGGSGSSLVSAGGIQRSRAEVKGIRYYTSQDVALGQFLVESCFQMHDRHHNGAVMMMDHTLSFIHRPGRIDISVSKLHPHVSNTTSHANENGQPDDRSTTTQTNAALINMGILVDEDGRGRKQPLRTDPLKTPIYLHSYCKECQRVVTPKIEISDETWKLSFGKFIEMNFYNHSARCRTGSCTHYLRDDHIMNFVCDGYKAQFEFVPIHALALHPRSEMPLPLSYHSAMIVNMINECVVQSSKLAEDFATLIVGLEKVVTHVFASRQEVLVAVKNDILAIQQDIDEAMDEQSDEVEAALQLILDNKAPTTLVGAGGIHDELFVEDDDKGSAGAQKERKIKLIAMYPLVIRRDMLEKALSWNKRIMVVYRFIDSVESMSTTAPSSSTIQPNNQIEQAEMPNDEELLIMRNTIMGHEDLNTDIFKSPSQGSISSNNSPGRLKVTELDSPRLSTLDDLKDNREDDNSNEQSPPLPDGSSVNDVSLVMPNDDSDDGESDNELTRQSITSHVNTNNTKLNPNKDKSTRLAKAIQRFRRKAENDDSPGHQEYAVGLDDLYHGRLSLPAGRHGRVIAVHEEQLATIVAYSLASEEYHDHLRLIQEEETEGSGNLQPDAQEKRRFNSFTNIGTKSRSRASTTNSFSSHNDDQNKINSGKNGDYKDKGRSGHQNIDDRDENEDELGTLPGNKMPSLAATRNNLASPLNPTFRTIVGEDNSDHDDNDHEEEEDDNGQVAGRNVVGHKSYKYLNFDYDGAMKLQGLSSKRDGNSRQQSSRGETHLSDRENTLSSEKDLQVLSPTPSSASSSFSRERILISQRKTHIKHRFNDLDIKNSNNISCKFICHIFYATQFRAVRQEHLQENDDDEGFIRSLSMADQWNAQGGKSGASFSRSCDNRFVVKHITRTELQMFLDFAPAYFEYLAKSFYHGLPTLLVKILGVYQIGYHNRVTGKRVMEQVVIMENLFYDRHITRIFDLKGSSRQRYVDIVGDNGEKIDDLDQYLLKKRTARRYPDQQGPVNFNHSKVCLDDNLMLLTKGKPLPLKHKAKLLFHKAVMNDTLFLSIINIVDYSILVGIDDDTNELVVGIIDYMRQYDIIKRMERMGKSVGTMIAGQAEPTVIQPPQYRKRFQNAMERYFMTVPDKWIQNDI